jgi:SAP domain
VDLLQRGFVSGSIITTDGDIAKSGRRRYVYNQATCLCSARIKAWDIQQRRAYACFQCQPRIRAADGSVAAGPASVAVRDVKVFPSRCAPDAPEQRLAAPAKMRVAELRKELESRGLYSTGGKLALVARLSETINSGGGNGQTANKRQDEIVVAKVEPVADDFDVKPRVGTSHLPKPVSAAFAAVEKAAIGESRAVEHVADVSDGTDFATAVGKMKVVDLRAALRERTLDASGSKTVLAERLVCADIGDDRTLRTPSRSSARRMSSAMPVETESLAQKKKAAMPTSVKVEPRVVKRVAADGSSAATSRRSTRRRNV